MPTPSLSVVFDVTASRMLRYACDEGELFVHGPARLLHTEICRYRQRQRRTQLDTQTYIDRQKQTETKQMETKQIHRQTDRQTASPPIIVKWLFSAI